MNLFTILVAKALAVVHVGPSFALAAPMNNSCKFRAAVHTAGDMAKKSADNAPKDSTAFANNPFAKLAKDPGVAATLPKVSPPPAPVPTRRPQPVAVTRLTVRHEAVGKSGKVVTRISGIPFAVVPLVAPKIGKALGCGTSLDGDDVILAGSLKERAIAWLEKIGDLQALAYEKPAAGSKASSTAPAAPPPPALVASNASGTYRKNVRAGMKVGIVLKEDQPTGDLTIGVVRDLLTRSDEHPHGIKVCLTSGHVGRVKVIYE